MVTVIGTSLTCPECGRFYSDIAALAEAGGEIRGIGLGLFATCPGCNERWPINKHWRCNERINQNGKARQVGKKLRTAQS